MLRSRTTRRGFTIVELLVSVAIFAFMTALLVSKYSNFNSSVLLTNAAYDIAIATRQAQTYGVSVKVDDTGTFQRIYGVNFNMALSSVNMPGFSTCDTPDPTLFTVFTNAITAGPERLFYTCASQVVTAYKLKRGAHISAICLGDPSGSCIPGYLDVAITFRRPNPEALIATYEVLCGQSGTYPNIVYTGCTGSPVATTDTVYVQISIASTDGSEVRTVKVYKNGQITVGS